MAFGFKVDFFPTDQKFLSKELATQSPISIAGRVCNNVDPLLMFSSFKSESPYQYDNSQNDPAFDGLFEIASKAVSTDDRITTLRKLSKYTLDKNFMIPMYENLQAYYFDPNTIKTFGNQSNPITLFLDQIEMKE